MLLAGGCAIPTLTEESMLARLQVMSVVVDPPLVRPGDIPTATAWVADPTGEGYELLLWTCTDVGNGCVEPFFDALEVWTETPVVSSGSSQPWIPDLSTNDIPEDVEIPLSVFALACAPGVCPEIAMVRNGDPAVAEILGDPVAFGQSLPIEGTSFARRGLDITGNVNAKDNDNPDVSARPPAGAYANVAPGASVTLAFEVSDETDMTSDGYATGGFMGDGSWTGHDLVFIWDAPSEPGDYELWVTIEDGTGGSAVWRGVSHVE